MSYLSTEETSGGRIRELCVICRGVYHPTVVLAASIQKKNLEVTEVLGRIVSVADTANHGRDSSDHSSHSDTMMDVTDLADLFGRIHRAHHRRKLKAQYGGGIQRSNATGRARSKHKVLGTTCPTRG